MSTPGRPTLADVAARAGVSLKTASRAVNGEYGVAAATAARVRTAARDLGFRPNQLARSLAGGGPSAAVGLLIPDVADPFVASVVGAVEAVLARQGLRLVTASHGDDEHRQRALVRALVERRVDGLLLLAAPGDPGYLSAEIEHGLVVVAMDRPLDAVTVDTVTVDNEAGAGRCVERLLARGHRRVAFLGDDPRLWTAARRFDGYREALRGAGIGLDPALVSHDARTAADAQTVLGSMLSLPDPPTAVFAAHHRSGRGAMRATRQAGVPLDIAVFDEMVDTDLLVSPPLVVATSGPDRIGRLAASMALERLGGLDGPPRHVVLAPLLLGPGERYVPAATAARRDT